MKKLISLISTSGKSKEQIAQQAWSDVINFRAASLGLVKCDQCGEYKGTTRECGEKTTVSCLCDGILCQSCGIERSHRPISNYFDQSDGKIWHVPSFHVTNICAKCRNLRQPDPKVLK